jgi:Zn-dependent protease
MAPSPGPLDLHWRLFGIDFRVQPSFWLMNLLFGYFYVRNFLRADQHILAYLGIWLICAFVSILIHELGHVTAGRVFGEPSNIVLYSMGGLAIGHFERLARWQRILVYAAGPAIGLALFAFVEWGLRGPTFAVFPSLRTNDWFRVITNPIGLFEEGDMRLLGRIPGMLVVMNLIWNVFNLIPILPLDGGAIMREVVTGIFPRRGLWLAYGFSFLLAGAIAAYSLVVMWKPDLPFPLDPLFSAIMFGLLAYSSFAAMQSVEPEPEPKRWREYEERDW